VGNGALAESAGSLHHERLREPCVRQMAQALQFVECLLDILGRSAARGQAIGEFGAAIFAPRQQPNGDGLERKRGLARSAARGGVSRITNRRRCLPA
jgi:hypothetical protein